MTDDRHDGLADVINLLAAPIAGGIRTVEQVKRGVDEMFRAAENLNRTMENLNEAASRINRFMAEIEAPVQALIPQITRTVQAAEEITTLLQAPVRATAPNIERIVNAIGSPSFLALPNQLGELMQRLAPLAQLAENAGGIFGGFRLPGMKSPTVAAPPSVVHTTTEVIQPVVTKAPAKKPAAKKTAAKKTAAKKTAAKKTAAKKSR
jgi:ABC-type transporter Mla subunit MlaD